MFKKTVVLAFIGMIITSPVFAKTDKCSKEYLQEKKHFAIMNPIAESFAQRAIKKSLKKVYVSGNVKNISRLKKKQIYYVKVRAYKLDSAKKKVYGAYSNVRKIRIEK